MKKTKLRESARGQECMIRIPGVCNGDPQTTVLAHYRMAGICGTGLKPKDMFGAFGCMECHSAVDGRIKTEYSRDELRLMHLEGVIRTQAYWLERGLISTK